ncbi:unnamed protein product, partial [Meganyctiphanes norvegica]
MAELIICKEYAFLANIIPSIDFKTSDNFEIGSPTHTYGLQHLVRESLLFQEIYVTFLKKVRLHARTRLLRKTTCSISCSYDFFGHSEKAIQDSELFSRFVHLRKTVITNLKTSKQKPTPQTPYPGITKSEEWCRLCFGNSFQLSLLKDSSNSESTHTLPLIKGQKPLLSILLNIGQKLLWNLIEWHCNWLEVLGFSEAQGQWLYALLACLEKPLTPETCSYLRNIARMCAQIRADLDSVDHSDLPQLNVIICIITRYFNQEDLADG